MIKLDIEEFLFEIKDEMLCYDEIKEEKYLIWEEHFEKWINDDSIKKENVKKENNKLYYMAKDESDIFDIVDEYYYAIIENRLEEYFTNFNSYM